LITVYMTDSQT